MITFENPVLQLPAGAPRVLLLDARHDGLDESGLRAAARALSERAGAPYACRSYRFPYALVACHQQAVGVDIERIDRFDRAFLDSISTPSERERAIDGAEAAAYGASLWSSKEALAKALGDALDYDPRRLESPIFWPAGRSGPWRVTSLSAPNGHNAWLCWREQSEL